MLPFEPACLPLPLGGLPHRDAASALAVMQRYAGSIIAWPQLPKRTFREQSFVQSALGFPGLVIEAAQQRIYVDRGQAELGLDRLALAYLKNDLEYASLANDDATGLYTVLRSGERLRQAKALKGQLIGPISLAMYLVDEEQRPLIMDQVLFDAICQHVHLRATWQEARLGESGHTTIVCLDEPFLELLGSPFLPCSWQTASDKIEEALSGVRGCRGLYAGNAQNWQQLFQLSVGLLIANIPQQGRLLLEASEQFAAFLERDGVLGLGILPNNEEQLLQLSTEDLVAQVQTFIEQCATAGIQTERLVRQLVISSIDSLGWLSVASAERALQLMSEVSQQLRTHYQLA